MFKKIVALIALCFLLTSHASAAPKLIAIKPIVLLAQTPGAEGAVITGKTIVTFGNSQSNTLDITLVGLDLEGNNLWTTVIDSGGDEIATAATVDRQGNIWLAGSTSIATESESATATDGLYNPDAVIIESESATRTDLSSLSLWQISPLGETKTIYSLALSFPILVNGISVSTSGISVIASGETGPILISAKIDGTFEKPVQIGTLKTNLGSVLRNSDGSIHLFGSSSETLGGKKVAGVQDGVLIKTSELGKIITVTRSSASKGIRTWASATPSNFLTGTVKSGGVSEIAITKFTSKFVPTWTTRIPGLGNSIGVNALSGALFVALQPKVLKGVAKWAPIKDQGALLTFSAKGILTGAYSRSDFGGVIVASYSKDAGLIVLANKRDTNIPSIFYLPSR